MSNLQLVVGSKVYRAEWSHATKSVHYVEFDVVRVTSTGFWYRSFDSSCYDSVPNKKRPAYAKHKWASFRTYKVRSEKGDALRDLCIRKLSSISHFERKLKDAVAVFNLLFEQYPEFGSRCRPLSFDLAEWLNHGSR